MYCNCYTTNANEQVVKRSGQGSLSSGDHSWNAQQDTEMISFKTPLPQPVNKIKTISVTHKNPVSRLPGGVRWMLHSCFITVKVANIQDPHINWTLRIIKRLH